MRVAIDLMGGESSPQEIFEAILAIKNEISSVDNLLAIAQHGVVPDLKKTYGSAASSIEFVTTEEAVEMHEPPLLAVRRKKASTMAAGLRLLKDKQIDAFVSSGNTGALVAFSKLHLNDLPGIERPALLVTMPTEKGRVVVLDVGANVNPKPQHLVSYAIMGTLYRKCMFGEKNVSIGLLNIGVEEQKGTDALKETYQLLQHTFKNLFVGNLEGREVFQGKVDVLITDGFTGNVFLKTSEGISSFLADYLSTHFNIPDTVSHLHQQFNYSEHPGALLCGVDGIVVKCHGFSNKAAFMNGIRGAITLVQKNILKGLMPKVS